MAEVEEPVEPHVQRTLYAVAKAIEEFVAGHYGDKQMGFLVAMFEMGDKGRFNYMSNAQRADIIMLLEEMIVKFKGS